MHIFSIPMLRVLVTLTAMVETCAALHLNLTAISANRYRQSTLECWAMDAPFVVSTDAGIAGSASVSLGNVTNLVYTVLPAGFDGGLHVAPKNQYVPYLPSLTTIFPMDHDKNVNQFMV